MPKTTVYDGVFVSQFSKRDQADARRIMRLLRNPKRDRDQELVILVDGEQVPISGPMREVFAGVLSVAARGDKATITSDNAELRTQQAADILNVSRQYLVRLCDEGLIPFRRQGTHRRLAANDVFAYKEQRDRERQETFRDLIADSAATRAYDLDIPWPPQD